MASTKPSDIASLGHDGDTELTPITNEMSQVRGYPMELRSGGVVNIVKRKQIGGGRMSYVDQDGREYVLDNGHTGKLVAYEVLGLQVAEAPAEPTGAEQITDETPSEPEVSTEETQEGQQVGPDHTQAPPEGA